MIWKVSFLIEKPEGIHGTKISDDDFEEFLKSELSLSDISKDNPLEYYEVANHIKNLKINIA